MGDLVLTPAMRAYLDAEQWIRSRSDFLRARLGDEALIEITGLFLSMRRGLGLPTRLRAIAGRRFPPSEAEIERAFVSPQSDGCGRRLTEED